MRRNTLDKNLQHLMADRFVSAPRLSRQSTRRDFLRMMTGNLGPTAAEQDQAARAANTRSYAQTGQAVRDVARAGLAAPSTQKANYQNTIRDIVARGQDAAKETEAGIRGQAVAQQQQEANMIQKRLMLQQQRNRENAEAIGKLIEGLTVGAAGSIAGAMA